MQKHAFLDKFHDMELKASSKLYKIDLLTARKIRYAISQVALKRNKLNWAINSEVLIDSQLNEKIKI